MSNSKELFRQLLVEIENENSNDENSDFLERLRKLTKHESVDDMVARFRELVDYNRNQ